MLLSDVDAYLARIGLDRAATLTTLHRAHVTSIAFENFDPLAGRRVSLAIADIEHKMVAARRGGYCFEHNLLFLAAVTTLGLGRSQMLLARVRRGDETLAHLLTHLCLRIDDERGSWLCDVGFGGGSLLEPVPFKTGTEVDQSGWRFRLVGDGDEVVLQAFEDAQWADNYSFSPTPAAMSDVEASNLFTSSDPRSPFVLGLFVAARREDRELTMFIRDRPVMFDRSVAGPSVETEIELDDIPRVLAERFSIFGVRVLSDGRVTL